MSVYLIMTPLRRSLRGGVHKRDMEREVEPLELKLLGGPGTGMERTCKQAYYRYYVVFFNNLLGLSATTYNYT